MTARSTRWSIPRAADAGDCPLCRDAGSAALALFTSLITISFMDQLRHRRDLLRRAIAETGVVPPPSDMERRALRHIGHRLDLPDEQIAETVKEATAAVPMLLT